MNRHHADQPTHACWIGPCVFLPCVTIANRSCGGNCQRRHEQNGPEDIDATAEDYDRVVAGATSITIWMTAVLPLAFLPAVVVKAMGQRVSAELNQKGVARESIEKPCAKVKLTGANWRVSRRYESTVSRCRVNFQKKLKSSAFALPRLPDGRYSGYLA